MYNKNKIPLSLTSLFLIIILASTQHLNASQSYEKCIKIAGAPTADAPKSERHFNEYIEQLAKGRPYCEAALFGSESNPIAIFHLAVLMQREGAHDEAIQFFSEAAKHGVNSAHTKLGDYYNFGIGRTKIDISLAVSEYLKAMEGNDLAAKSTMALMHQIGRGVTKDLGLSYKFLEESADAGYHFAQVRFADILMSSNASNSISSTVSKFPDPKRAIKYYKLAASQGSLEAQEKLQAVLEEIENGSNSQIKIILLQDEIENGDPIAMNKMGFLYERGEILSYDPEKAAALYIQALETGNFKIEDLRGKIKGYRPYWDRKTALEFQKILFERGLYRGPLDAIVGYGTLAAAKQISAKK